jgi:hypothetical protein
MNAIIRLLLLIDPIDQGGAYELRQLNWMARRYALMGILFALRNKVPRILNDIKNIENCPSTVTKNDGNEIKISSLLIWQKIYEHENLFRKIILYL